MNATLTLPLSALELCEAIRHARPFNAARLDRILRLDASRGHVEVQASAAWTSVAEQLRGRAGDAALAWAGGGTVGESLAANAPGPDGRPFVAHVEALTVVGADGELRRASRASHAEIFRLAIGGHGLFGTVYSVTLSLESLATAALNAQPCARLALPATSGVGRPLQLLVPPEKAERFLADVRAQCAEWRVAVEGAEVRRTLPESETALPWARREWAAVTLLLSQPPALGGAVRSTQLRRALIDCALAHGGSFPIARTPEATRAQVEACYPELRAFLAEKRRLDPAEKIVTDWYRHHRSLLGREGCAVRFAQPPA